MLKFNNFVFLIIFARQLTSNDYMALIWASIAEFPGYLAAILLIDQIGRKKSIAVLSLISVVSMFCLAKCTVMSRSFLTIMLFCSRGSITGWMQVLIAYTPEVYATRLRAVAMGEIFKHVLGD